MSTIQWEEIINQLYFSTTDRASSHHHSRLRRRDGGLSGLERNTEKGPYGNVPILRKGKQTRLNEM